MEVIENKALKMRLRNPHRVLEVIPKSKIIEQYEDGTSDVLVHWSLEAAQVLKNLRIKNVPSPIMAKYKWPGTREPFTHQKQTAAFLTLNRRAFVLSDPGTGKTLSMIWAADYLMNIKQIKRVLVICPVSVMKAAWVNDLFHGAMHRTVAVAHGTRQQRKDVLAENTEFVIINFDGVELLLPELQEAGFDMVIIDEANFVKTATTNRWKAINKLIRPDTWLWMATGTPASQSPLDAYGLVKMMHPSTAPRSFGIYRDMVMSKVTTFKWVPKRDANSIVNRMLQPAIRFTKEDCLDLPDILYTTREVPLTKQQWKLYEQLRKSMAAQVAGETISAVNAAVGLQKLLQVSCLSSDTQVLTDSGWKYILDVTTCDNLWDGIEWVSHGGVVHKGKRHTLNLSGVRMTGDHQVLTVSGWHTCKEIIDGASSNRFERATVRIPDGFGAQWVYGTPLCNMAMPVRLWEQGREKESKPTKQKSPIREPLWMSGVCVQPGSWDDPLPPIQNMVKYAASVFRQTGQRLQKLWRTGGNSLRPLGKLIYQFLGGHAEWVSGWAYIRSEEQQRAIQPRKLLVGDPQTASKQYPDKSNNYDPKRSDEYISSSRSVWDQNDYITRPSISLQMVNRKSVNPPNWSEDVYDIINAGPRNRFTVLGNDRPFIVHNCGTVYTDDKSTVELDISERFKVLEEVIDSTDNKVLVFVPYTNTLEVLQEKLLAKKYTVDVIYGKISAGKRADVIKRFQEQPDPRVLLIQPQAASHGITLHAADTIVWWGPIMSYETYVQANARIHRAGQKNKCLVVRLQGSPVEEKRYKALDTCEDTNESLLEMFKQVLTM